MAAKETVLRNYELQPNEMSYVPGRKTNWAEKVMVMDWGRGLGMDSRVGGKGR